MFISEPYRQSLYWNNDAVGNTSLLVTLFNGWHAASETLVCKEGLVGIRVEDTMCVVTGSMPIHIKAKLRWKEYEAKKRRSSEVWFGGGDEEPETKSLGQVEHRMDIPQSRQWDKNWT